MLQRQNQMVQFLSKALQHPEVLSQLVGARQRVSSSSQAATGAHRQLLFAPPTASVRFTLPSICCGIGGSAGLSQANFRTR